MSQIQHIDDIASFVFAGSATGTLFNAHRGTRLTFKFVQPKKKRGEADAPTWVSVLTGPNNETDFEFLGTIWRSNFPRFVRSHKSRVGQDAPSMRTIDWLVRHLASGAELPPVVSFRHEGRCGRCGRKLTVPESIDTGLGPVCASRGR